MIIDALEFRRAALAMPYTVLGRRAGISSSQVYGIMQRERTASIDALQRIAIALGGGIRVEAVWPDTPEEMRLEQAGIAAAKCGIDADTLLRRGKTVIWLENAPETANGVPAASDVPQNQ